MKYFSLKCPLAQLFLWLLKLISFLMQMKIFQLKLSLLGAWSITENEINIYIFILIICVTFEKTQVSSQKVSFLEKVN